MKTLTFLFMPGSMATAFGQSKFALSIQLAPVYTHADSKVIFPFGDPSTQLPATEFRAISNGLSYSLGVAARYAFSPKWSIGTGIWATHSAAGKSDYLQNSISYTVRY